MNSLTSAFISKHRVSVGPGIFESESCIVTTRRGRWYLFSRSHTTVSSGPNDNALPPFAVWWTVEDPAALRQIHAEMVRTITRVGFREPATWAANGIRSQIDSYWSRQLGDSHRHYKKTTSIA
jgi:hypothetical protein